MEKYAFFLDIDGTLASGGKIHERNINAIHKAQAKGHFFFINTGRSYSYIPQFVKKDINFDGFISGLGADIRIGNEQIFSKTFSNSLLLDLAEMAKRVPDKIILFEGEEYVYFKNTWYDVEKGIELSDYDEFKTKYKDAKISKVSLEPIDKSLFTPFLDRLTLFDHGKYFETAIRGCNKATAMLYAAERIGIPKERCVAMGDSLNDEDMLDAAGISVVMENGHEKIKQIADIITENAWDGGVASAIEKITKI